MDVDKMEAGRELDALVAEKIMGWQLRDSMTDEIVTEDSDYREAAYNDGWHWDGRGGRLEAWQWQPSIDIVAAWEVVERLCELPSVGIIIKAYPKWNEKHERNFLYGYVATFPDLGLQAVADTAPLAICRAALKAILNGNP